MSDLQVLEPTGKEVRAGGETITVKPIKLGQLPQAARLISPISKQIAAAFKAQGGLTVADTAALFVDLLAQSGDDLLAALGFFIGKPREWLDNIGPDEGAALFNAVYRVNMDFFINRVLPLFAQAALAAPNTDGETSSPSFSEPGTPEPTSTATP